MDKGSGLRVAQDGTVEGDGWVELLASVVNRKFILPEEQPNALEGKYVLKVKSTDENTTDEIVEVEFINDDGTPIWKNLPSEL